MKWKLQNLLLFSPFLFFLPFFYWNKQTLRKLYKKIVTIEADQLAQSNNLLNYLPKLLQQSLSTRKIFYFWYAIINWRSVDNIVSIYPLHLDDSITSGHYCLVPVSYYQWNFNIDFLPQTYIIWNLSNSIIIELEDNHLREREREREGGQLDMND